MAAKLAVQIACETFEKAGGHFEDPKAELLEICRTANEAILKLGETPKLAPRSLYSKRQRDVGVDHSFVIAKTISVTKRLKDSFSTNCL